MTRNRKRAWLALLAGVLLLIALPGYADSQARIVRLSDVRGDVQIDRHTGQGFERAILNMPVTQATLLRTGSDGRAEVEFEDGTVVRLVPEAEADFQELSLRDSGAKVSTVEVNEGTVYFNVHHRSGDEFTVLFAGRELPVTGSAHFRLDVTPTAATLAMYNGKLAVEQDGNKLEVKKGQELSLALDDNSTYVASNIESNQYDHWDQERRDYHERYYSDSSYSSYPYYGRGDLSYYGGWYNIPGYGALWQPYNAGWGWSPFSSGYWCWYPGFGYTWVSSYPWGWLPYRYGSWVWVPNWGWGWMPGTYWTYWRPVPTVVDPPSGFTAPVPPNGPNRPTVVVRNNNRFDDGPRGRRLVEDAEPIRPPRIRVSPTADVSPRTPNAVVTSPAGTPTASPTPRRTVGETATPQPRSIPPGAVNTPRVIRPAPSTEIPRSPRATPAPEAPRTAPPAVTPRSAPAVNTPRSTSPPQSNFRPSGAGRSMDTGRAERMSTGFGGRRSMEGGTSRGASAGSEARASGRRP